MILHRPHAVVILLAPPAGEAPPVAGRGKPRAIVWTPFSTREILRPVMHSPTTRHPDTES